MDFSTVKSIVIKEGAVKKIECNGVTIWQEAPSIKNWARCSINQDGTVYNNGQGYKVGYRVRSGGAEGEALTAVCTGFIPLKNGDTLRIYPPFSGNNTENAINFYKSDFTVFGQITDAGTAYGSCTSAYKTTVINGVSSLTLDSRHNDTIAYVRITHITTDTSNGANFIITINQEIP